MQHYVDAICSHGSADGFSTEGPERLHIDYAKNAYRATNKKKYISQMTKWLTRQEKCHRFDAYLAWAYPQEDASGPDGEEIDLPDDAPAKDESTSFTPGYHVSKHPAYPHVPISSIIGDFGTPDFLSQLEKYLHDLHGRRSSVRLPNTHTRLDAFKCISIDLPPAPQVTKAVTKDIIQARRIEPATKSKDAIPSQYDTVLVRLDEGQGLGHPLDGM